MFTENVNDCPGSTSLKASNITMPYVETFTSCFRPLNVALRSAVPYR